MLSGIGVPCIGTRMEPSLVDDQRVLTIWAWCSDAYLRRGVRLSFPKNTNPAKTYQWRYVSAIAKKFDEWELDEQSIKKFIEIAVTVSKENGTLNKGLAVLHQSNILAICYDKLKIEIAANNNALCSLQHIDQWLKNRCAGKSLFDVLLSREDEHGFCKLLIWYQASRLSPLYIALSRICGKALSMTTADEQVLLPRPAQLYMLKTEFLKDINNHKQVRALFAQDWREARVYC